MVYSALSDDTSTVSQFTRRKAITITTEGTSVPASYQVKLVITFEPEMQADFDDLRFNTRARTYIDYWVESYTASTTAIVWIELPDAITDPGSDYIWMYYGNASLSDGGNGDDTFLFFDDFPGSSLDGSKWDNTEGMTVNVSSGILTVSTSAGQTKRIYTQNQYPTDTAIRTLSKWSATGDVYAGFGYYASGGANYIEVISTYSTNQGYIGFKKDPNSSDPQYMTAASGDVTAYNIWDVKRFNASVKAYLKDTLELNYTTAANIPTVNLTNEIMIYSNTVIGYFDWYLLRKLIVNEPTLTYGTAQHQRRISQFIG